MQVISSDVIQFDCPDRDNWEKTEPDIETQLIEGGYAMFLPQNNNQVSDESTDQHFLHFNGVLKTSSRTAQRGHDWP